MKSLGIMGLEVADHEPYTPRSQGPSVHYRRGFATREGGEDCANTGRRTGFEPAVSTQLERARCRRETSGRCEPGFHPGRNLSHVRTPGQLGFEGSHDLAHGSG